MQNEEAYQADINALWKRLDFLEFSRGSSRQTDEEIPNPNEGEIPI